MRIRKATATDVPAMTQTLNWAIDNTQFVFRKKECTLQEGLDLFATMQANDYPYLVAESDNGKYLGWALLKPHKDPLAWDGCFEDSIYLEPCAQGKGVGHKLLAALLDAARADTRIHTVLALITTTNSASLALHEKLGFKNQGTLRELSYKNGQWLDLCYLQIIF